MAEYMTQDYIVKRIENALNRYGCCGYYGNGFWGLDYFLDNDNYAIVIVLTTGNIEYTIVDEWREPQKGTYAPTKANTTRLIKRVSRFMADNN